MLVDSLLALVEGVITKVLSVAFARCFGALFLSLGVFFLGNFLSDDSLRESLLLRIVLDDRSKT